MTPPSATDPPGLESDRKLLEGYRRGDREALAEVFRRYLPMVMRALRGGARVKTADGLFRLPPGVSESELEALAQDTFLRAFSETARKSYDGVRPFSSYLGTIAKNLLVDAARKRARQPLSFSLDELEPAALDRVAQAPEVTSEAFEAQELKQQLAVFVGNLDEDHQALWNVRFVQQRSLREAARTLGRSLFTLRKQDARLRLALLEHLREGGFLQDAHVDIGTSVLERRGRKVDDDDDEA